MDSIILRPLKKSSTDQEYFCTISQFSHAIRIPCSTDGTTIHMITPQPFVGAWNVQYIAPEVWIGQNKVDDDDNTCTRPFDGYSVDLWAVGVMLLSMLFGNDSIFVAPVLEDRIFQQISIHGKLSEFVKQHKQVKNISVNAIDLLQKLLQHDPKDRPTLEEVLQHPWVLGS
jgi:serine/threonine protein kinase